MKTLPVEFSKQISVFAPLFSKKVFEHAKLLVLGCILSVGKRTVCGCLHTLGLGHEKQFHKYHRVLNLAKWSAHAASAKLLQLLVNTFFEPNQALVFGIDETLERRWGPKIKARAIYRDSVRSSGSHFTKSSGLRWMCLMLLSPIPWANRIWALPFFTALCPSERFYQDKPRKHKKLTDWARQMILQLHRWLPHRKIIIVADASYCTYELLDAIGKKVSMITRLRLDARLFDFPLPNPKGKRGPKPIVGPRQPQLVKQVDDPTTPWTTITLSEWYGQKQKKLLFISKKAIWYKSGMPPVPCRWILLRDPEGKAQPTALICTDLEMIPIDIIRHFVQRWSVEVTFEEVRKHLGVETQRQWSDLAIARTTPVLMALFSLVTLWAHQLNETQPIAAKSFAWYQKSHPTFSDAIACVRRKMWYHFKFQTSLIYDKVNNLFIDFSDHLISLMAKAA
jgi:hypothetical protein